MNMQTKKEFCLAQIAPYYLNPDLCAYNPEVMNCQYLTFDGRMCVLGKNLIDPGNPAYDQMNADSLLTIYGEEALKPEARGILTGMEWNLLQSIHDTLANPNYGKTFEKAIEDSDLFTFQELKDYAKQI